MKKIAYALCFVAALATATYVYAQSQSKPPVDPRIDKLLEQNEKILKNQDDILKQLADLKEGVLQIRRRSS